MNLKRFLPVRIFNIHYGYGWWWANYFFFFGKYHAPFSCMPMDMELQHSEYADNCRRIEHGDTYSWSKERQRESKEPKI